MKAIADRFHERQELRPEESFKVFLFVSKAFAAMGFLFALGHIAATGQIPPIIGLVITLAAVLDLAPEIVTIRMMGALPARARQAEQLQLLLKAVAYGLLLSIYTGAATSVFWAYAAFAVLWICSFLVEESVMFLLGSPTSG